MSLCTNCNRAIDPQNFVIHSLTCHRHNAQCNHCSHWFCNTEKDEHTMRKCDHCGVMRAMCQEHKCEPQDDCIWCGIILFETELEEHQIYCGNMTEECVICYKRIMRRHFVDHVYYNHTPA
jgi:hypothetical protein